MIDQQIVDYIKQQTATGATPDSIRNALVGNGWLVQDVSEAFAALNNLTPNTTPLPTQTTPAPVVTKKSHAAIYIGLSLLILIILAGLVFWYLSRPPDGLLPEATEKSLPVIPPANPILNEVQRVTNDNRDSLANDAKIKSLMGQIRTSAEIYYGGSGKNSYGPLVSRCTDGIFSSTELSETMGDLLSSTNQNLQCESSPTSYAISAKTTYRPGYWCIDSSGNTKTISAPITKTSCE